VAAEWAVGGGQAARQRVGAGGAHLAAFGLATAVTWHRKRATTGGDGMSWVKKKGGAVVTHLVTPGSVLLAFVLTIVDDGVRKPKTAVFVSRHEQAEGGNLPRGR
jgi:hypothetical protein